MTVTVVFCTSAAVNRNLLNLFNDVCGRPKPSPPPGRAPVPPLFISARARKMSKEDDGFSQTEPDLFDGWPDDRCEAFFEEYFEPEKWIDHGLFATLDERSTMDNTVVIHARKPLEKVWESWRVKFEDAYTMHIGLTFCLGDYHSTFTQADRFIVNGVFPVAKAIEITDQESLKESKMYGQNKESQAQKPISGMRLTMVGKKHNETLQDEGA